MNEWESFCIWVIAGILMTVGMIRESKAGPYGVIAGGVSQYNSYSQDPAHDNARFCDIGFQCNADLNDTAYQIGLGWKFKDKKWGLNWATEAIYHDFGHTKLDSKFPSDVDYDVPTHTCLRNCDQLYSVKGDWHYQGLTVSALPSLPLRDFNLYGKLGLSVLFISGNVMVANPGTTNYYDCGESCKANTTRYGYVLGTGVSYERWHVKPFIEFNYLDSYGGGFPPAESLQTYMFGIRIPLQ